MPTSTPSSLAGTGNQPYTKARVDYLASYLQSLLPGLNHDVAVMWIRAEQGVNGNVLGVTYHDASGQHLYTYSSQEAGLRAAVSLLKRSSYYTGILASLGKSSNAQLTAIAASPWNGGHYRNGATFGLGGIGDGGTPVVYRPTPFDPNAGRFKFGPGTLGAWYSNGQPTVSFEVGHVLSAGDVTAIVATLDQHGFFDSGNPVASAEAINTFRSVMMGFVGQEWNVALLSQIITQTGIASAQAGSNPFSGAASVLGFILDFENIKYSLALFVGVPLALFGFYLLAGVPTSGQNA